MGAIVVGVGFCVIFFLERGYLPPPFFFDTNDNLMDWFNTAYWSQNGNEYFHWRSIYPPLSFGLLRFLSIGKCYTVDPFIARSCDWLGTAAILAFFTANLVVTYLCFRAKDRTTAIQRAVALGLGFPMLSALDRGNLVLPTFLCFALAWGDLFKSRVARWVALALSINLKPYLAITLLAPMIGRRWRVAEGCVTATLAVYLLSLPVVRAGLPLEVLSNEITWVLASGRGFFEASQNATSYTSLLSYLTNAFTVRWAIGVYTTTYFTTAVFVLMRVGQLGVLSVLIFAVANRPAIPSFRIAALALSLVLSSVDLGGYSETLLIFLVFLERADRPFVICALASAYVLCVPFDVALVHLGSRTWYSYLGGRMINMPIDFGLAALCRPGLLLITQFALVAASYNDLWRSRSLAQDAPDQSAVSP